MPEFKQIAVNLTQNDSPDVKRARYNDRRRKSYGDIQKVVSISILDHTLFNDTTLFLTHFTTREKNIGRLLHNSPEHVFFELKKCMESEHCKSGNLKEMTPIEKWGYVMKEAPKIREAPSELKGTPQLSALLAINKNKLSSAEQAVIQVKIQDQIEADEALQQARDRAQQAENRAQQAEKENEELKKLLKILQTKQNSADFPQYSTRLHKSGARNWKSYSAAEF